MKSGMDGRGLGVSKSAISSHMGMGRVSHDTGPIPSHGVMRNQLVQYQIPKHPFLSVVEKRAKGYGHGSEGWKQKAGLNRANPLGVLSELLGDGPSTAQVQDDPRGSLERGLAFCPEKTGEGAGQTNGFRVLN